MGLLSKRNIKTCHLNYHMDFLFWAYSMQRFWESIVCIISHVWLFVIPWTADLWAPLSMGFSRQEYWSGLPFPPPGDLPNPGIKPKSSASVGGFCATWETPESPVERSKHWHQLFWRKNIRTFLYFVCLHLNSFMPISDYLFWSYSGSV